MNVDTLFIAQIITAIGLAVGLSMFLVSTKYPPQIRRSLRTYSYGKFQVAIGFLIAGLRGEMAPELLVPLANGLIVAGVSLNYVATRQLQGKLVPRHLGLLLGIGVALSCWSALQIGPADLTIVRFLSSVVVTALMLMLAAELLLLYEGRGIAHYLAGVYALVVVVIAILRIGAALTQPSVPVGQFINDGPEQVAFFVTFLGMVMGSINFTLMASDEFNKELTLLANTDGLTGVLNRRRFLELGEAEFRRARRHNRPLTVLIIDIDRFKSINDIAGHPFGDRVIQAVADCCTRHLREDDSIGRLGGEEFAILLPESTEGNGQATAEHLRAAIERDVAPLAAEKGVTVTCSVGGVSLGAEHSGFADLIAQSDAALYVAKRSGRNLVHFSCLSDPTAPASLHA